MNMDRQTAGALASSVLSLCGVVLLGVGALNGDQNSVVIGASVMMMAGGTMAAVSASGD